MPNVQGIQTRWHLLARAGGKPHLGAHQLRFNYLMATLCKPRKKEGQT
jgi:hypothetical protein